MKPLGIKKFLLLFLGFAFYLRPDRLIFDFVIVQEKQDLADHLADLLIFSIRKWEKHITSSTHSRSSCRILSEAGFRNTFIPPPAVSDG